MKFSLRSVGCNRLIGRLVKIGLFYWPVPDSVTDCGPFVALDDTVNVAVFAPAEDGVNWKTNEQEPPGTSENGVAALPSVPTEKSGEPESETFWMVIGTVPSLTSCTNG